MRFVLMLLAFGLVGYLYLQRSQHQTKPPPAIKDDFVAGFKNLFVTNCSGADRSRVSACACLLDEMEQAKAIQFTPEEISNMQARLDAFLHAPGGTDAKKRCGFVDAPSGETQVFPAEI